MISTDAERRHQPDGPLVSVVSTFFEAERFIGEAIDSVCAQTWPNWELLVVDDGSRDASRDIANGFRERMPDRIRVLEHPGRANRGISASRNLGLSAAGGDYVAFLDADDAYLPTRLERHVSLLERNAEAGAVQGCHEYWRSWPEDSDVRRADLPQEAPPVPLEVPIQPPDLLLLMLDTRGLTTPGICDLTIRRTLLLGVGGFNEDFRSHYEDQVAYAKLYLATPFLVIDDRLARYRQHPDSVTGRYATGDPDAPHRWYAGRTEFLAWLEAWLVERGIDDQRVWKSLGSAWRIHRRAHLFRWRRQFPILLRRLARALLPHRFVQGLLDWWGRRKLAVSAWRAKRAYSRIERQSHPDAHDPNCGRDFPDG